MWKECSPSTITNQKKSDRGCWGNDITIIVLEVCVSCVCVLLFELHFVCEPELVRLRFQQSGLILFCSSARALACIVKTRRSSLFIFFQHSPRSTLMALLSLPGYICVYCTLYCLANSMKAFIGRLHFVIVAQLFPDRLASLGWLFVGFWWCSRWACVAGFLSGDTASLLDCDSRRRRAILLKT